MENKKWRQSFEPRIRKLRAELGRRDPAELAEHAGAQWDGEALQLSLLGSLYRLHHPELVARSADEGDPCPEELQALLLDYLNAADGTLPTDKWVSFRELPQGEFYFHAFKGYAERPLVETLGNDLDGLREAALRMGGEPIEFGDCGFAFHVLPRVRLAVVYWSGDDEFSPHASVLFDAAAHHYLPVDGLANLGRMLTSRMA
ncbi:MAG: DUF3786 domain-containing protein, partial [Candidatus Bipolaricaulota bacterium]